MVMKTMQDYTLFCTAEQAKRAYALGAPIDKSPFGKYLVPPTTYSMSGWLRTKKHMFFEIFLSSKNTKVGNDWRVICKWEFRIRHTKKINPIFKEPEYIAGLDENNNAFRFDTYEEAESAAIDAALEHLEKGK